MVGHAKRGIIKVYFEGVLNFFCLFFGDYKK